MREGAKVRLPDGRSRETAVRDVCRHLKAAIDAFEQVAIASFQNPRGESPVPPSVPAKVEADLPAEKLAYGLKEAALAVGIGRTSLYEAISSGQLAAFKLGGRTLIMADELQAWLCRQPYIRRRRNPS